MSLVQGIRRPFEESSASDLDSRSNPAASSENDSDEQDETDDSPWDISTSSGDGDDEFNPGRQSNPLYKCDEFHTTQDSPARDARPTEATLLYPKSILEMPKLLKAIDLGVICLYKIPIRRPAPLDRLNQKASVEASVGASYYQPFDVLYVKDKFPDLDLNVATRLGKMVTRRRQLLFYRLSHDQKLKTTEVEPKAAIAIPSAAKLVSLEHNHSGREPMGEAPVGEIARSQVPSTQHTLDTHATTRHNEAFQHTGSLYAPSTADSKLSLVSSYAGENILVEVPPRPKGKDGKELASFKCPYCLTIQHIKSERVWK